MICSICGDNLRIPGLENETFICDSCTDSGNPYPDPDFFLLRNQKEQFGNPFKLTELQKKTVNSYCKIKKVKHDHSYLMNKKFYSLPPIAPKI